MIREGSLEDKVSLEVQIDGVWTEIQPAANGISFIRGGRRNGATNTIDVGGLNTTLVDSFDPMAGSVIKPNQPVRLRGKVPYDSPINHIYNYNMTDQLEAILGGNMKTAVTTSYPKLPMYSFTKNGTFVREVVPTNFNGGSLIQTNFNTPFGSTWWKKTGHSSDPEWPTVRFTIPSTVSGTRYMVSLLSKPANPANITQIPPAISVISGATSIAGTTSKEIGNTWEEGGSMNNSVALFQATATSVVLEAQFADFSAVGDIESFLYKLQVYTYVNSSTPTYSTIAIPVLGAIKGVKYSVAVKMAVIANATSVNVTCAAMNQVTVTSAPTTLTVAGDWTPTSNNDSLEFRYNIENFPGQTIGEGNIGYVRIKEIVITPNDNRNIFVGFVQDVNSDYSINAENGKITSFTNISCVDGVQSLSNTTQYGVMAPGGARRESWESRIAQLTSKSLIPVNPPVVSDRWDTIKSW